MSLDVTTLRIAATLACFAAFLAICAWAYAGRNRASFEEAGRMPLQDD